MEDPRDEKGRKHCITWNSDGTMNYIPVADLIEHYKQWKGVPVQVDEQGVPIQVNEPERTTTMKTRSQSRKEQEKRARSKSQRGKKKKK